MDLYSLIFIVIKNTQKYKIFSCSQKADTHISPLFFFFFLPIYPVIYLFMRHECQRMSAGEAKIYY